MTQEKKKSIFTKQTGYNVLMMALFFLILALCLLIPGAQALPVIGIIAYAIVNNTGLALTLSALSGAILGLICSFGLNQYSHSKKDNNNQEDNLSNEVSNPNTIEPFKSTSLCTSSYNKKNTVRQSPPKIEIIEKGENKEQDKENKVRFINSFIEKIRETLNINEYSYKYSNNSLAMIIRKLMEWPLNLVTLINACPVVNGDIYIVFKFKDKKISLIDREELKSSLESMNVEETKLNNILNLINNRTFTFATNTSISRLNHDIEQILNVDGTYLNYILNQTYDKLLFPLPPDENQSNQSNNSCSRKLY